MDGRKGERRDRDNSLGVVVYRTPHGEGGLPQGSVAHDAAAGKCLGGKEKVDRTNLTSDRARQEANLHGARVRVPRLQTSNGTGKFKVIRGRDGIKGYLQGLRVEAWCRRIANREETGGDGVSRVDRPQVEHRSRSTRHGYLRQRVDLTRDGDVLSRERRILQPATADRLRIKAERQQTGRRTDDRSRRIEGNHQRGTAAVASSQASDRPRRADVGRGAVGERDVQFLDVARVGCSVGLQLVLHVDGLETEGFADVDRADIDSRRDDGVGVIVDCRRDVDGLAQGSQRSVLQAAVSEGNGRVANVRLTGEGTRRGRADADADRIAAGLRRQGINGTGSPDRTRGGDGSRKTFRIARDGRGGVADRDGLHGHVVDVIGTQGDRRRQ